MDFSPVIVVEALLELVKTRYPGSKSSASPSVKETLLAEELLNEFDTLILETIFEDDVELDEPSNSNVSSFSQQMVVDDEGKLVTQHSEDISLERKVELLKFIGDHPSWSIQTFQKKGAIEYKTKRDKIRWEKQVQRGGTRFEQWKFIDDYTYEKFQEARKDLKCVRESNVRLWALQAAQTFRDPSFNFKASHSWITRFKDKHGISSRKVTKVVSRRELASVEAIQQAASSFQSEIKSISGNFPPHLVFNTDQAGFTYEFVGNRTLSNKGEKITVACAKSPKNLATHSYTCQYVISAAGTIVGDVFLCLQEPGGRMGETVKKNLFTPSNVVVTCSASGKLSTSLYEYFLDNVIVKSVKEDFLLIVDSWSPHTNEKLYESRFGGENNPSCTLKIIPKNCTSLCQPLDTTFHLQLKYFQKAISHEFKMNFQDDVHPTDELYVRNNQIRMHSLIHNQFCATILQPLIQYCWFSSGLTDNKPIFKSVKEACFCFKDDPTSINCSTDRCENVRFIKCAHCRNIFCFACFFYEYHFHFY